MNTVPKFGKVELLRKISSVEDTPSTTLISFDDCGLMITGDYIIVILDEKDEMLNTLTSNGKIFPIKDILEYKTYNQ